MPAHAGLNIIHGKAPLVKGIFLFYIKLGFSFLYKIRRPGWGAVCFLAAATVVVAAAVVVVCVAGTVAAVVAAAAEQDQQDDDPPDITAAEIVVAHKITSEFGIEWLSRSFHGIL